MHSAPNGHGSDSIAERFSNAQHNAFKMQVEADNSFSTAVGSVEELARKVQSAFQMEEEFEEMFEYPEGYLQIRSNSKSASASSEIPENGCSKLDHKRCHFDGQNAGQETDSTNQVQLLQSCNITSFPEKKDRKRKQLQTEDKYRLLYSIDISDSSEEDISEDQFHGTLKAGSGSLPHDHLPSWKHTGSTAGHRLANTTAANDPILSYSDFEDEYFVGNGQLDVAPPPPMPTKSTRPQSLNGQSRANCDHSFTPLHAIEVPELKQLLWTLQKRVQGMDIFIISSIVKYTLLLEFVRAISKYKLY